MDFPIDQLMSGDVAKAIGKYLGLVEDLDSKINKLIESEYKAGMSSLEQAMHSATEKESLLREARNRFNKAIHLEKKTKLALSYMGLALCHQQLGDQKNAETALRKIVEIPVGGLLGSIFSDKKLVELQESVYQHFGERSPQFIQQKWEESKQKYLEKVSSQVQLAKFSQQQLRELLIKQQVFRVELEKEYEQDSQKIKNTIVESARTMSEQINNKKSISFSEVEDLVDKNRTTRLESLQILQKGLSEHLHERKIQLYQTLENTRNIRIEFDDIFQTHSQSASVFNQMGILWRSLSDNDLPSTDDVLHSITKNYAKDVVQLIEEELLAELARAIAYKRRIIRTYKWFEEMMLKEQEAFVQIFKNKAQEKDFSATTKEEMEHLIDNYRTLLDELTYLQSMFEGSMKEMKEIVRELNDHLK